MRVDVVSIFPDYLAPLELSLLGKARERGLVDLHIHDLRAWTHDRHRTVDDTPYGGGAGMVMKPEPWGDALDAVIESSSAPAGRRSWSSRPRPVRRSTRPSPSSWPGRAGSSSPAAATKASTSAWSTTTRERLEVRELSLGDFVLNGGEVAAMAMIEAVVRLLPGFMGNPESLAGGVAQHRRGPGAGLLEYPVYTKPASWRGLEVPEVLRSGDHARIEEWRRDQARRRTVERRPDLLTPAALADRPGSTDSTCGSPSPPTRHSCSPCSAPAGSPEAQDNEMLCIPPLTETLDDVRARPRALDDLDAHGRRASRRPRSVAPAATPTPPSGRSAG